MQQCPPGLHVQLVRALANLQVIEDHRERRPGTQCKHSVTRIFPAPVQHTMLQRAPLCGRLAPPPFQFASLNLHSGPPRRPLPPCPWEGSEWRSPSQGKAGDTGKLGRSKGEGFLTGRAGENGMKRQGDLWGTGILTCMQSDHNTHFLQHSEGSSWGVRRGGQEGAGELLGQGIVTGWTSGLKQATEAHRGNGAMRGGRAGGLSVAGRDSPFTCPAPSS